MASPAGNPNQPSTPFDMQKLFKPPSPSPVITNNPSPGAHNPNLNFYSPPPPIGPFSYPLQTTPFHPPFLHYPQSPLPPNPSPNPTPNPSPNFNPNASPNPGARLMALLGTAPPSHIESAASVPQAAVAVPATDFPPVIFATPSAPTAAMARVASSKMPRGRFLGTGERVVYDVDVRLMGESVPPQLEVTPITKYFSDPGLVLGRQIAVNRTYICYGLKLGNIRVLNINTAIRSLFRGHSQRVTDMAFFAEDVHLLASASADGKVFVWKIDEGPDEENKPQITGKIVVAVQIVGDGESYHPRICWHSHKQEVLMVAIGNRVLKIDSIKVGRGKEFSVEEPLKCPIDKLIDGVQLIGKHEGDVTDLSISQWMITRLASASKDGTVKIWDDRKSVPLVTLRPHEGHPVSSVAFLTSPCSPEHIVLITAGPLNREVKLWTSTSEGGWLLPSDSETWQSTQTLELRSSSEPRSEEAFFNQVVVLPRASLILLANAKKNAIYAVHVDYGPCPSSTRMDYIADFTVTMPILSLTGTSDNLPDGEQVVQIYCVQTQAIQQYALELSQCSPPPVEVIQARDSGIHVFEAARSEGLGGLEPSPGAIPNAFPLGSSSPKTSLPGSSSETVPTAIYPVSAISSEVFGIPEIAVSNVEVRPTATLLSNSDAITANAVLSPSPLNMDISGGISILRISSKGFEQEPPSSDSDANQQVDYQVERRVDHPVTTVPDVVPSAVENLGKDDAKAGLNDNLVPNSRLMFKLTGNTTHLVTPSEILSGALSSSEAAHASQGLKNDEVKVEDDNSDLKGVHIEVKQADATMLVQHDHVDSQKEHQAVTADDRDKSSDSRSSEVNNEMPKEGRSLASEICSVDETRGEDDYSATSTVEQPYGVGEEALESSKDSLEKGVGSATVSQPTSAVKGKKQKIKQSQASGPSSPSLSPFNSTDSLNEPVSSVGPHSIDAASSQLQSMQDMLNQLMSMQKEMQKQMNSMIAGPINKEGKRVETALGRSMEKAVKSNVDALWSRFQEETTKSEKLERERMQQLTNLITNSISKELPAMFERTLKKEISSVAPVLARTITPVIEKTISSAIADSFQRGVGDKAVGQLEKSVSSKLETTVARQIQTQFQTSGKQALQEALRSSLESSAIPVFEQSCKTLFNQVDAAFQKGMNEYITAAQQQLESAHTPLAITLRDAISSASSITQNITSELADGQRKILALVGANSKSLNPITMHPNNGPMGGIPEQALSVQQIEAPVDPTKELSKLIAEHKFGEAFTMALQRSDVSIVSWLCSKVDLHAICSMNPLPLNQGVLLALLQQLACDISNETAQKLGWMTDVAVTIIPTDPMITQHVRPIFEQVYNILAHQRSLPTIAASDATSIRIIMHVINSVLMSCK